MMNAATKTFTSTTNNFGLRTRWTVEFNFTTREIGTKREMEVSKNNWLADKSFGGKLVYDQERFDFAYSAYSTHTDWVEVK